MEPKDVKAASLIICFEKSTYEKLQKSKSDNLKVS